MIVECSGCHSRYRVDESKLPAAGGRFKCKKCDSSFEVKPHLSDEISADKEGKTENKNDGHAAKKRIVFADDTAFFRAMITDLLSEAGYEVITAVDGEDALDKIRHTLPDLDLVLLDMLMPKLDGFQVIEELRRDATARDLPILALSGIFKSDADREHMKELGVAGYVDKDTSPDKIVERVDMILHPDA
jgi:predicted Zn finger-like uncharacterized protein